jgi:hypothetical protein
MDKAFLEYDWRTDSFAPMFRVVSDPTSFPPRPSKSSISHIRKSMDRSRQPELTPLPNPVICCVNPSALQRVPDKVRLSSYLLASQDARDTSSDASTFYATSPISRDESVKWSPLQQFIASCETAEAEYMPSRIHKRSWDRTRMPRESRHTFQLDSVGSDRTIVTRRSRANTWDPDVTTFNAFDNVSSLEEMGKLIQQSFPRLYPPVVSSAQNFITPSTTLVDG